MKARHLLLAPILSGGLVACSESSQEITDVRDRAASLPASSRRTTSAGRFGFERAPGRGGPHRSESRSPIAWELPEGWQELEPTTMRLGNFRIERDPETECTLTVLPGSAGGLDANLNRWRGQMGLDPLSRAEIEKLPRHPLLDRPAHYMRIEGTYAGMGRQAPREGYVMQALILGSSARSLFLKMTGPQKTVDEEAERFLAFAASIRLSGGHSGHGSPTGKAAGESRGGLSWEAPEEWEPRSGSSMRVVTYGPRGVEDAECSVTILGGDGGGVLANINRWRDQMGQGPVASIEELDTIDVLGRRATFVEIEGTFSGMGEANVHNASMLAVVCRLDGRVVFVKFTGPSPVVQKERERFLAFCRSLRSES